MNAYMTFEWWKEWLSKRYQFYGTPSPEWGLHTQALSGSPWNYSWYENELFHIGYRCFKGQRPWLWIKCNSGSGYLHEFSLENPNTDLFVLEALSDPKTLPLCLNTWAEPLMAECFKEINSQVL